MWNPSVTTNTQSSTVSRIVVHPQYNAATLKNDIAILRLTNPVSYSSTVNTICMPPSGSSSTTYVGQRYESLLSSGRHTSEQFLDALYLVGDRLPLPSTTPRLTPWNKFSSILSITTLAERLTARPTYWDPMWTRIWMQQERYVLVASHRETPVLYVFGRWNKF